MLRYKTENRPGLVALYDIRTGNGAGQFLQPWNPYGAVTELDLRLTARRFNSRLPHSQVQPWASCLRTRASVTKQCNWVSANVNGFMYAYCI